MALSLNLSFQERNDNTALIITDITGTEDSTDWGQSGNISYTAIDAEYGQPAGSYYLSLHITITTSDNVSTVYDRIDLYDEFGPFVYNEDLTYTIDSTLLKVSGIAIGTATDTIPDGVWDIRYTVTANSLAVYSTLSTKVFVNGVVKVKVYEMLRAVTTAYECPSDYNLRQIKEAEHAYAYLLGMEFSSDTSKVEEILFKLSTLERIVIYGSKYPW